MLNPHHFSVGAPTMTSRRTITTDMEQPQAASSSGRVLQRRNHRGQPRKTLMDRVLVTPSKNPNRSQFRFQSTRPNLKNLSRSLRHRSQRTTSEIAFAPYPKPSLILDRAKATFPQTPQNRLRRTLSEPSQFNGSKAESSISSKVHLRLPTQTISPTPLSHAPGRSSRSGPPLMEIKPQNLFLNNSSAFLMSSSSTQISLFPGSSSCRPGKSNVTDSVFAVNKMDMTDGMELDLQDLRLEDLEGQVDEIDPDASDDYSWSLAHKSSDAQGISLALGSGPLFALAPIEPQNENEGFLLTRLRQALAVEIRARKQAEKQHRRELKRRIEMEELVANLKQSQRDQKEHSDLLLINYQPPPSSSPLLLSSSPCNSSRLVVNTRSK